ncbi:MAG: alcohol dehydrogenase catalytic domain-containing protein, partial [Acidobacteria bacterium]|nr:alcohol dehydrogenase catalytic domain-containing protein [Acidobacteriota bacterium]
MDAMRLERVGAALVRRHLPPPSPGPGQVRLAVRACGVCRTDLHVVDGDLRQPKLPLILGHEIVGEVVELGVGVDGVAVGERLGVPWLGGTCGHCRFCRGGRENLCDEPVFTGYQVDGGYAEETLADPRFCFPIPDAYGNAEAAPLLCAGLIGYRALRMSGDGRRLGLYGFGAAAHLIAQVAVFEGREVYAFTRPGDEPGQAFARSLGAVWAGGSDVRPPVDLDAAILFAPVG